MQMSSSISSREDSPDWLRSFQAPTQLAATISSESISPANSDDADEISLTKLFQKESSPNKEEQTPGRKRKRKGERVKEKEMGIHTEKGEKTTEPRPAKEQRTSEKPFVSAGCNHSVWALSSDSDDFLHEIKPGCNHSVSARSSDSDDSLHEIKPVSTDITHDAGASSLNEVSAMKAPKKKLHKESDKPAKAEVNAQKDGEKAGDMDLEEKTAAKCSGLYVSSSRLPLVLAEKVHRTKALVECEGDSIDLSGDVGAVGRVVISEDSFGHHEMLLDLKGFMGTFSHLIGLLIHRFQEQYIKRVSFGQSEAKIEGIMNDFIQLKAQANVFEAETMVEGTLDGFSFDSEEEMDNMPKSNANNQGEGEGDNEQSKGKTKQKAGKASTAGQKKIKAGGGKKVKKKSQAPKKSKTKK